ncbi:MAG: AAA family ATPase [Ignavibacteriae bacterium]|nr:AAA family ATPase [Ignavibacteriota bacterium]
MPNISTLRELVLNWNSRLPYIYDNYLYSSGGNLLPRRKLFNKLESIINNFLNDTLNELEKIFLITGIKGTGKTTLLLQALNFNKYDKSLADNQIYDKVYVDVGKLKNEGFTLNDFLKFYETEHNLIYENNQKKIIFVFDEVHYDDNWGLTLKNFFDATKGNKNVLVLATGSSAIKLRLNTDLARRSTLIELFPLQFTEYLEMKYNISIDENLSTGIADSIINSPNAVSLYDYLVSAKTSINEAIRLFPANSVNEFFLFGGFPFNLESSQLAFEKIKNVIDNIILKDIVNVKEYKINVVSQINLLVYLLANSDTISIEKIKKSIKITDNRTIYGILDSIADAGLITKVKAFGGAYTSPRKTPKFLFNSPSIRAGILDGFYNSGTEGKKLEDYFSLLFNNVFIKNGARELNYDAAEGGADFIIRKNNGDAVIVETGYNKNKTNQILKTNKKVNASFGVLIGSDDLTLEDDFAVKIPVNYLMLI